MAQPPITIDNTRGFICAFIHLCSLNVNSTVMHFWASSWTTQSHILSLRESCTNKLTRGQMKPITIIKLSPNTIQWADNDDDLWSQCVALAVLLWVGAVTPCVIYSEVGRCHWPSSYQLFMCTSAGMIGLVSLSSVHRNPHWRHFLLLYSTLVHRTNAHLGSKWAFHEMWHAMRAWKYPRYTINRLWFQSTDDVPIVIALNNIRLLMDCNDARWRRTELLLPHPPFSDIFFCSHNTIHVQKQPQLESRDK